MFYVRRFTDYSTVLPLFLLPFCLRRSPRATWSRSYSLLMTLGFGAAVAAMGGDAFPAYRFLVPIFPFLYLLVADAAAGLEGAALASAAGGAPPSRRALASRALGMGLLGALLALTTFHPSSTFAWREWERGNEFTGDMRMVGRWLREHVPPQTWIAVNAAGALPWESELRTIDMLGLNDREIALTPVAGLGRGFLAGHEKGNGDSVLRRRPEIILVGGVTLERSAVGKSWTAHFRSEQEIAVRPDLYEMYVVDAATMPDGRILTFLRRRDALLGKNFPVSPAEASAGGSGDRAVLTSVPRALRGRPDAAAVPPGRMNREDLEARTFVMRRLPGARR
jgi:hypothetical protein